MPTTSARNALSKKSCATHRPNGQYLVESTTRNAAKGRNSLVSLLSSFLHRMRGQIALRDAGAVTDRDLLERFRHSRDGDAFAAQVFPSQ